MRSHGGRVIRFELTKSDAHHLLTGVSVGVIWGSQVSRPQKMKVRRGGGSGGCGEVAVWCAVEGKILHSGHIFPK